MEYNKLQSTDYISQSSCRQKIPYTLIHVLQSSSCRQAGHFCFISSVTCHNPDPNVEPWPNQSVGSGVRFFFFFRFWQRIIFLVIDADEYINDYQKHYFIFFV